MQPVLMTAGIRIPLDDAVIMGCTLYGEMSGRPHDDVVRTGSVILNRYHQGWASSITNVCLAKAQFNCWDTGTRNRLRVFMAYAHKDPLLLSFIEIARSLISGGAIRSEIGNANSYFAYKTISHTSWSKPPAQRLYKDTTNEYWYVPWVVKQPPRY